CAPVFCLFFFQYPAAPETYTLSLHDALPICAGGAGDRPAGRRPDHHLRVLALDVPDQHPARRGRVRRGLAAGRLDRRADPAAARSEEHTSELQSRENLVCRLLLEKKNNTNET